MDKKTVYYIMAGGEGMRLWPLSRSEFPKQLHNVLGNQSLFQQALKRVLALTGPENILIGTRQDLFFSIKEQWESLVKKVPARLILEPVSRNTAPAVALAALACRELYGEDIVMVCLSADHVIRDMPNYRKAVHQAELVARDGAIVTFGIKPTYPETGYGYIKLGKRLGKDVFVVDEFKEKPDPETAVRYLKDKKYLWNSGMFVFSVKTVSTALKEFAPEVWNAAQRIWSQRREKNNGIFFPVSRFRRIPGISFDYAVMEKAKSRSVIKAGFTWCDVGCWSMVYEMSRKDGDGNVFSGDVYGVDTRNSFIRSEKRAVACVGVQDLVVIDTPDALLISRKDRSQDVKRVVEKLNAQKSPLTKTHTTVYRPWGNFTVLEEGPGYKIKRVVVNPRQQLSLQKHNFRSEHWVVISGKARIVSGADSILLKANESFFIPRGRKHRIMNSNSQPLVIIEVQTGAKVDEADIVRYQDVYERQEMS